MPVVRTDSRVVSRSVYGHVITKFSWMEDYHISLAMGLRPHVALSYYLCGNCSWRFPPPKTTLKEMIVPFYLVGRKSFSGGVVFFWGECKVPRKNLKKKRHVRVLHSFQHLTSNTTRKLTNWRLSHDTAAGSHHSSALPSCRNLNLRFVVKTTTLVHAAGKFSHRFWSLFSSFHK